MAARALSTRKVAEPRELGIQLDQAASNNPRATSPWGRHIPGFFTERERADLTSSDTPPKNEAPCSSDDISSNSRRCGRRTTNNEHQRQVHGELLQHAPTAGGGPRRRPSPHAQRGISAARTSRTGRISLYASSGPSARMNGPDRLRHGRTAGDPSSRGCQQTHAHVRDLSPRCLDHHLNAPRSHRPRHALTRAAASDRLAANGGSQSRSTCVARSEAKRSVTPPRRREHACARAAREPRPRLERDDPPGERAAGRARAAGRRPPPRSGAPASPTAAATASDPSRRSRCRAVLRRGRGAGTDADET